MTEKNQIEILDKIAKTDTIIEGKLEVFINPHDNEPYVLSEYVREGFEIFGIIIHEDLSVEFLYKRPGVKIKMEGNFE